MKIDLPLNFSIVDLETTGLSPVKDRIIDVGIIRVENGEIVSEFESLVNPLTYIPEEILAFTGIDKPSLERAPVWEELSGQIRQLLTDSVFVAHNARFDYGFIKNEFKRFEQVFNAKTLCTVKLSRHIAPGLQSYSLDNLISEFDLTVSRRHRAYDDARAIYDLLNKLSGLFGNEALQVAIQNTLKRSTLPKNLAESEVEKLPHSPGTYYFYDSEGILLYVGKAKDIKSRVRAHFSSDHKSQRELNMLSNLAVIDYFETAGELGALIKESQDIKALQPIYNRMLRRQNEMIAAVKAIRDGIMTIELTRLRDIKEIGETEILAVYRSKKAAQIELGEVAKENKLCPIKLGLEKGKGACFAYQMGNCSGVCTGAESPLRYNIRFIEAFNAKKVPAWPFSGPVKIIEKRDELYEEHVIDNWCYLSGSNKNFDWDMFKIIKRFIYKNKANLSLVVPEL